MIRGKLWDLHDLDNMNDYHLFTIDEINTNDNSIYLKKIERITESRLKISGINKNGYEFFPIYDKEEKLYKKIVNEMKEDLGKKYEKLLIKERRVTEEKYKANRISKYARTHLFHECKPYSYAGFKNIIQISSGIVRQFLNLASGIYDKELSKNINIKQISFKSQKEGIKEFSNNLFESRTIRKMKNRNDSNVKVNYSSLFYLIEGLGKYFNQKFYNKEKIMECIFSFRVKGDKIKEILDLGVIENMFQTKLISSSEGTKITEYSLNRGLCPRFDLDLYFKSRVDFNDKDLLSTIKTGKIYQKPLSHKIDEYLE